MAQDDPVHILISRLAGLGLPAGMLDMVRTNLPANRDDPAHWMELAYALRRQGNYAAAHAVYLAGLSLHDGNAMMWNNLGVLLRDWGKPAEALAAYDAAIARDPDYASPLAGKGQILEKQQRWDEARRLYAAALVIRPDDANTLNNMGACHLGEGHTAEAAPWFERSLAVDPDFGDALFNLAAIRYGDGDLAAARPLAARLVRLFPDDAEAAGMLARIDRAEAAPGIEAPAAQTPDGIGLRPEVAEVFYRFRGNPRSLFISYAWPDEATKAFALRLAADLAALGYDVFLDRNFDLEVHEVLTLLAACQNVIVLNDRHYAESCLLGHIPVTQATSPYPSFAFPAGNPDAATEVFKISALTWHVARQIKDKDATLAAEFALQLADPHAYERVPGLRLFIEGWRVDEAQMIFTSARKFRSITTAFLGGDHCLGGYPVLDFSKPAYYDTSFSTLTTALALSMELPEGAGPVAFDIPDRTNYRWPESEIVTACFWRLSDRSISVWRPSITPSGDVAAVTQTFRDWEQA